MEESPINNKFVGISLWNTVMSWL